MKARDCYRAIRELTGRGERVAAATVIRTRGSTPREPGAKMLVLPGGNARGTIGGGCGEAEVLVAAREMLDSGQDGANRLVRVDLTEQIVEAAERICGGVMDVLLELWERPREELDLLVTGDRVVRVTPAGPSAEPREGRVYSGEAGGGDWTAPLREQCERTLGERASRCAVVPGGPGEGEWFFEYVHGGHTLVILGAGHIAQPLCRMAKLLDFRVVVVDDRPAFASDERFPEADLVVAEPFDAALGRLKINEETMVVLVTRGHRHDEACLRRLLGSPAPYLGLLGSKRRVRAVYSSLLADGYTHGQLERVWGPVGVDIGAHSPAEIAISILAELVALQRGRLGGHMKVSPPRSSS
jgi:xanthine dehydrogenase accessory factor